MYKDYSEGYLEIKKALDIQVNKEITDKQIHYAEFIIDLRDLQYGYTSSEYLHCLLNQVGDSKSYRVFIQDNARPMLESDKADVFFFREEGLDTIVIHDDLLIECGFISKTAIRDECTKIQGIISVPKDQFDQTVERIKHYLYKKALLRDVMGK